MIRLTRVLKNLIKLFLTPIRGKYFQHGLKFEYNYWLELDDFNINKIVNLAFIYNIEKNKSFFITQVNRGFNLLGLNQFNSIIEELITNVSLFEMRRILKNYILEVKKIYEIPNLKP